MIELLERGALQQVGTGEGDPFESYFSGNTIQICPVGALTSAAYRFRSRPFDLVSSPSRVRALRGRLRDPHRPPARQGHAAAGGRRPRGQRGVDLRQGALRLPVRAAAGPAGAPRWCATPSPASWSRRAGPRRWRRRPAGWPRPRGRTGVLTGGRLTVEDAYAYAKFARVALDTNDIDFRARRAQRRGGRLPGRPGRRAAAVTSDGSGRHVHRAGEGAGGAAGRVRGRGGGARRLPAAAQGAPQARTAHLRAGHVTPPAGWTKAGGTLLPAAPGTETEWLDALAGGVGLEGDGSRAAEALRADGAVIVVGERLAAVPGALTAAVRAAAATGAQLVWIPRRAGERGAVEAGALPVAAARRPPGHRPAGPRRGRRGLGRGRTPAPLRPGHRPDRRGRGDRRARRAAGRGRRGRRPARPGPRAWPRWTRSASWSSWSCGPREVTERADVVLPVAAVAEKAGTFLNWEGRARLFEAALKPDQMTRRPRARRRAGAAHARRRHGRPPRACRTCAPYARGAGPARRLGRPARHRARGDRAPAAPARRRRGGPRRTPAAARPGSAPGGRRGAGRHPARGASPGCRPPRPPRRASRTATCSPSPARPASVELPLQVTRDARPGGLAAAELHGRRRRRRHRGAARRPSSASARHPRRRPRPTPGGGSAIDSPRYARWPEDLSMFGRDPWWLVVIKAVFCFAFLMLTVLFSIVWERKVVAWMQLRIGPNRHGPWGMLQSLADGIKLMLKEDLVVKRADKVVYVLAPIVAAIPAFMAIAVIPFGPAGNEISIFGHRTTMQLTDLPIAMLYILAVASVGIYGIVLAGWSSGSTYPLLGGLRSCAQMISYEIAMGAAVRLGVPLLRVDVDVDDRRGAAGPLVHPAAAGLLHHLHRHDGRRDQPRPVRHAGVRGRPRRRLQHRVLVDQVRDVHARRVRQHGDRLGRRRPPSSSAAGGPPGPISHLLGGREPRLVAAALVRRSRCSCCCSSSSGCAARFPGSATTS